MIDRRTFLKFGSGFGAGLILSQGRYLQPVFAGMHVGMLDPREVPKYVRPLVVPPAMPRTRSDMVDYYEIAVRQFKQEILPPSLPKTTVWSYGSVNHPATFIYPAFTIEASFNKPVQVKWINELKNAKGDYLAHLLPVDPTLHWANPGGGIDGRDMTPTFRKTPRAYTGPVPMVTHLHGGRTHQESDGYPEAWYLPAARNIPAGFASEGTWYEFFQKEFFDRFGIAWQPGTATFEYENDQAAATLWYHDHTLGMTRLNVYAGPAGFYLLRGGPGDLGGGVLPGPAPQEGADPLGRYFEIPIAIQDRSFNQDGSLFYPSSRAFFDNFHGPYVPISDVPPIWNPEFFGNTMVVNGRSWPSLTVEPRRYRLRLLNGCNSRFVILKLVGNPLAIRPAAAELPFWQIGSDGGFLNAPVELDQLLLGPAERADVIVDFTGLSVGSELYLINEGPDEPFGGGVAGSDFPAADPATTGQVMRMVVAPLTSNDTSVDPAAIQLPSTPPLGLPSRSRKVSLNEEESGLRQFDGPVAALLGTVDSAGNPEAKMWDDAISENPAVNAIEIWEIYNFTEDAHPIHIHEVQFEVVDRQVFDSEESAAQGAVRPAEAWENGPKDTVIAYPGEITRVKAHFENQGLFVWHCHILEHEDNEMMRPYYIGANPPVLMKKG